MPDGGAAKGRCPCVGRSCAFAGHQSSHGPFAAAAAAATPRRPPSLPAISCPLCVPLHLSSSGEGALPEPVFRQRRVLHRKHVHLQKSVWWRRLFSAYVANDVCAARLVHVAAHLPDALLPCAQSTVLRACPCSQRAPTAPTSTQARRCRVRASGPAIFRAARACAAPASAATAVSEVRLQSPFRCSICPLVHDMVASVRVRGGWSAACVWEFHGPDVSGLRPPTDEWRVGRAIVICVGAWLWAAVVSRSSLPKQLQQSRSLSTD